MPVSGKEVGTDAAYGAAAGTMFGPEGTLIGGAGGAIYGALDGAFSQSLPNTNANNFTFGTAQGSIAQPGARLAQAYGQQGQNYRDQGAGLAGQANAAYGYGQQAQGRSAGQISANPYDRRAQLAALQGTNANAAQLNQLGTAPMGPSVAAAQLQQGQDAAMNQSLAMARSGRSLGSGAAAMNQAQFQNAQTEQATNQQAVGARLQEQQQYRQMQLGALGASQQGYGMAANQAGALNASDTGLQAQNIGFQQQQQGINNQTLGAYGQIGAGLNNAATNRMQLGQGYDQMGFNTLAASLGASEQYQNSLNGNGIAQAGIDQQNRGAAIGLMSAGAGAAANYYGDQNTASDRDAKKNISPANGDVADAPWYSSWGALANAIGGGHDKSPGAPVRDPNNPSRTISPFAGIGAASNGAHGDDGAAQGQRAGASARLAQLAALQGAQSKPPAAAPPMFAPGTSPPDTWGGAQTPVQAGFAPQQPDYASLDPAYASSQAAPSGFQVSDGDAKDNVAPAGGAPAPGSFDYSTGRYVPQPASVATVNSVTGKPVAQPAAQTPMQQESDYLSPNQIAAQQSAQQQRAQQSAIEQSGRTIDPAGHAIYGEFQPGTAPQLNTQAPAPPPQPGPMMPGSAPSSQPSPSAWGWHGSGGGRTMSDVHSKTAIHALSSQNDDLRKQLNALSGAAPSQDMLNQAAADQDAAMHKIVYPKPQAPPSLAMLNQAAADQDLGAKIKYPDDAAPPSRDMLNQAAEDQARASDVHSKTRINELEGQLAALNQSVPPTQGEQTQLRSGQDAGFQKWLQQNRVSDLDNPDSHYDYRGAYLGGVGRGANTGHFPDTYKQHGHPTFSIESQYSKNANDGGTWDGEKFSPQLTPQAPDTAALDEAYAREGGAPHAAQPAIDLRPATGYSYEYKDPEAHGQGRFYGPMAQDLEKTPAGASTVKMGPDGTKMVDTSRLSLVNTAAISDLQKQIAALGGGSSYPQTQKPDYGKIDLYRGMQRGGAY